MLSPEVRAAMEHIAHGKDSGVEAALPLCRLPYRECWLEWPGAAGPLAEAARRQPGETEALPRFMGALLRAKDESYARCEVSFAWELVRCEATNHLGNAPLIEVSSVGWLIDFADGTLQGTMLAPEHMVAPNLKMIIDLSNRHIVEQIAAAHRASIEGEIKYVIAALALINSRNCIAISNADVSGINKARVKLGKRPVVRYKEVGLSLSKRERAEIVAGRASARDMALHMVRGHFKTRSSGVYWWRPFTRGSAKAGEVRHERYSVAA